MLRRADSELATELKARFDLRQKDINDEFGHDAGDAVRFGAKQFTFVFIEPGALLNRARCGPAAPSIGM